MEKGKSLLFNQIMMLNIIEDNNYCHSLKLYLILLKVVVVAFDFMANDNLEIPGILFQHIHL